MVVTGTGASGDEAYAIGKSALDAYGAPACYVNFPNFTTADFQASAQYLVHGLRVTSRRADRKLAILGISQGALLPRLALTYRPSLRRKVSHVLGAAGRHHSTINERFAERGRRAATHLHPGRVAAGGRLEVPAGAERPARRNARPDGLDDCVRSTTDETVQPQAGRRPTSALEGATNVLIQDVCPGRQVTHIGTVPDSVAFELLEDAVRHKGPAKLSRLHDDVWLAPVRPRSR